MVVFGNSPTTFASSPPVPPLNLGFVASDFFRTCRRNKIQWGNGGEGAKNASSILVLVWTARSGKNSDAAETLSSWGNGGEGAKVVGEFAKNTRNKRAPVWPTLSTVNFNVSRIALSGVHFSCLVFLKKRRKKKKKRGEKRGQKKRRKKRRKKEGEKRSFFPHLFSSFFLKFFFFFSLIFLFFSFAKKTEVSVRTVQWTSEKRWRFGRCKRAYYAGSMVEISDFLQKKEPVSCDVLVSRPYVPMLRPELSRDFAPFFI